MDYSTPLHVPHQGIEVVNLILHEMSSLGESRDSIILEKTVLAEVLDSVIPETTVLAEVNDSRIQGTPVSEGVREDSNLQIELLLRLMHMGLR